MKRIPRVIRKEIAAALEALESNSSLTDTAIHDARKAMKRARAGLRLMRNAIGGKRYRRENRVIRDAARPLSEIRDARVVIEMFDNLIKRSTAADRRDLAPMRAMLTSDKTTSRTRVLRGNNGGVKPIRRALRSARGRTKAWPSGRGWSTLGPGLRRVYRAGRAAFTVARRKPTVENLHDCRKQAKYLWHQLEFVGPINPSRVKALENRAHELSDHIGRDHDLALLEMKLVAEGAQLSIPALGRVLAKIQRRRKGLQAKATIAGARVYAEPTQAFVRRLERYWRA